MKKKPIRILQTSFTHNLGGIEMIIMNIYRHIDRDKIQFDFIDDCGGIYYKEEIEKLGGRIIKLPTRRENYFEYKKIINKIMSSGEYTAVHCNCLSVANIDIAKAAYKYGKTKVIIHSHQDMKLRNLKSELLHRYNRIWLSRRNIVRLACSEKAARWIHGNKVTDLGKVKILHNAIDIEKFKYNSKIEKEYRDLLDLNDKYVIGCVGRFAYQKNYEFLAEIFKEIKNIQPDAVLVCVGGDGGMEKNTLSIFSQLDIINSVRLLGIREDVEKVMQTFDAFVLPSRWEGLGIVYIEAQAAGIMSFASDVVPKEAKVTNLLNYISLNEKPDVWARKIIKSSSMYSKEDTTAEIKKYGYDINIVSKEMQKLYLEIDGSL